MPLYLAAIKKEENCLGGITWKPFIWSSLSRGNFMVDSCLGVSISGQLFYGAIIWAPIVQWLIIRGEITVKTFFLGGAGWGVLAVGQLSCGAIVQRPIIRGVIIRGGAIVLFSFIFTAHIPLFRLEYFSHVQFFLLLSQKELLIIALLNLNWLANIWRWTTLIGSFKTRWNIANNLQRLIMNILLIFKNAYQKMIYKQILICKQFNCKYLLNFSSLGIISDLVSQCPSYFYNQLWTNLSLWEIFI